MDGTTFQEVPTVAEAGVEQEVKRVWTLVEMFAKMHGDRHLHDDEIFVNYKDYINPRPVVPQMQECVAPG